MATLLAIPRPTQITSTVERNRIVNSIWRAISATTGARIIGHLIGQIALGVYLLRPCTKSKRMADISVSEPGAVATGWNSTFDFTRTNDTDHDPLNLWPVATAPGSDVESSLCVKPLAAIPLHLRVPVEECCFRYCAGCSFYVCRGAFVQWLRLKFGQGRQQ